MNHQPAYEDEIDLLEYWDVIWRRKKIVLSLFLISVFTTTVVSLLLPNYYKATTTAMATGPETGGLGAALSSSPLAGVLAGATGIQTPSDKVMVVLKSRTTAEAIIRKFDLLKVFNHGEWNASSGTWNDPADPPFMEDAVKKLTKDITTFRKTKEGAVTVTVEWKDPGLAADMANYYIAALTGFLNKKSINITIQVVDRAVPAERKSRPTMRMKIVLAGIMGLFLGVFSVFFLEYLQNARTARHRKNRASNTAETTETPEA